MCMKREYPHDVIPMGPSRASWLELLTFSPPHRFPQRGVPFNRSPAVRANRGNEQRGPDLPSDERPRNLHPGHPGPLPGPTDLLAAAERRADVTERGKPNQTACSPSVSHLSCPPGGHGTGLKMSSLRVRKWPTERGQRPPRCVIITRRVTSLTWVRGRN